jgi:hypothetical protein
MQRPDVSLFAVTRANRHSAVTAIESAVSEIGGWIDDVNIFSNLAIAMQCVIPTARSVEFGQKLQSIGLRIDPDNICELDSIDAKMGVKPMCAFLSA